MSPKPLLPRGVARDVRLVIEEQVCLDVGLAGAPQERELIGPEIRVVILWRRARSDVTQAGRGGREEVLAQRRLMFGAVSPELAAGLPQRPSPSSWATAFCTISAWTRSGCASASLNPIGPP